MQATKAYIPPVRSEPDRLSMKPLVRPIGIAFAVALAGAGLAGCGSINERVAATVSDAIPAWAGGLPADAPPRPGTAKYDEYMRERERKRLMPAAEREAETKAPAPAPADPDAVR